MTIVLAKPDAYPIVWINNDLYTEDICKVEDNQNPNWGNELDVDYDEGSNTVSWLNKIIPWQNLI